MDPPDTPADPGDERSGFAYWAPAVIAATSLFLGVLDTSMMNVAVPAIVRDLETTVSAMQGAIAAYSMVMAALIIPGGTLRAAVDTRRLLVGTLGLYSVGTLLAGLSWSMPVLFLSWSVIEGVAAALLLPITYSIILENYAGRDRAKAFGAIGGVTAVGVAVGPILGGLLTTFASWRWGFLGEFLLVVVVVGLTLRYLPSRPTPGRIEFDAGGTVLSVLAVLAIVGGSLLAGQYGWIRPLRPFVVGDTLVQPLGLSPAIWCILFGVALLVAFVQWEFRRERVGQPTLIPVTVLQNRPFAVGVLTFASESLFLAGFMFTVPVFLQSALGYSAFDSGVALLPFSAATLVLAVGSTGWRDHVSQKRLIQSGLVLVAVGLLVLVDRTAIGVTVPELVVPMTIVGVGLGLFTGQIVDLTMSAVPGTYSDVSSGVINSLSQLGYAFGTAVAGSVLLSQFYGRFVTEVQLLASGETVTPAERRRLAVRLADAREAATQAQQEAFVRGLSPDLRRQLGEVVQSSMVSAQRSVLLVLVVFVLLTLLVATFIPVSRPTPGEARTLTDQPDSAKSE